MAEWPQGCNEVCDTYTSDIAKMIMDDCNYEFLNISSNSLSFEGALI